MTPPRYQFRNAHGRHRANAYIDITRIGARFFVAKRIAVGFRGPRFGDERREAAHGRRADDSG
jgi:hypothetical protein